MMHQPPRYKSYAPTRQASRRGNPYFNNRSDKLGDSLFKNVLAKITPRAWFSIITTIVVIVGLFWLGFISNILLIKKIEVRGNNLVPVSSIEQLAYDQTEKNRWLVFRQDRWAVFNTEELKTDILARYKLNSVLITKKLPDTILVQISEKTPAAVWFEADIYSEIDNDGWILSDLSSSLEGLPTIYNNGLPKISDRQVKAEPGQIQAAIDLSQNFPSRFSSIVIKQLVVDNEMRTIKLIPIKGAIILFSLDDTIDSQLKRLDILLASELKGKFDKLNYIDLRFADRVYYK